MTSSLQAPLLFALLTASAPAQAGWSLVGVYDGAALSAAGRVGDDAPADFVWVPAPGMSRSCGPAKAPDGLGVFEAEAIGDRLAPTLAVLLEATDGEGPLDTEGVRVSLGRGEPEFRLHPAVTPRSLSVRISGSGALRHKQLVRTQLEMELCMEHKVGRGWIGGETEGLRQAFLLDPPRAGGPDRKYFGGQRDPVPALLGPPDACLRREEGLESGALGGKGEGSLDLVPSDVWGASLRWCAVEEVGGSAVSPAPRGLPLSLSEAGAPPALPAPRVWEPLEVTVNAGGAEDQAQVTLRAGDAVIIDDEPLFSVVPGEEGAPPITGITDLLARVPYRYPTLGTSSDPDRYTLLLIPNWQIVEGLRRLARDAPEQGLPDAGDGIQDGVGAVLADPALLVVQTPGEGGAWLNLTDALEGGPYGLRSWGYNVGMLAGRQPIALPGHARPSWDQVATAHRAGWHGLFLGALAALVGLAGAGLRRIRDLWTPVPEERAAYWPGRSAPEEAPAAPPKGAGS